MLVRVRARAAHAHQGGAQELRFIDGRPPRRALAVLADNLAATIEALRSAL